MIKAVAVDRPISIGVYTVRARTITIDEDGFELAWSISPAPTRPDLVEDPDSGRIRFEQFVVPIVEWRIHDSDGRFYEGGDGSGGGDLDAWQMHSRYRPTPPQTAKSLEMTLVMRFSSDEMKDAVGKEIDTFRVPLD